MCECFTIEEAVFSPNNVSVRKHLLSVRELQADGEGDFGSRQSRRIVSDIKNHSSTCTKTTVEQSCNMFPLLKSQ